MAGASRATIGFVTEEEECAELARRVASGGGPTDEEFAEMVEAIVDAQLDQYYAGMVGLDLDELLDDED